ncbi:MAG: tetratricopeptide repeat protein [Candidatus Obscuribacterales bacterium]|nr:tetratricopeptide repeat protein [Candidatus Obscuribacterales bacterium]
MEQERTNKDPRNQSKFGRQNLATDNFDVGDSSKRFVKGHAFQIAVVSLGVVGILAVAEVATGLLSVGISTETDKLVHTKKIDVRKFDEPLQQLNLLLTVNPFLETARLVRARILTKQHKYKEALADYDFVLNGHPDRIEALERRAAVEIASNNFTAALADCNKLIDLQKEKASEYTYADRAVAHLMLGQKQQAVEDYSSALKIKPSNPDFYLGRADCYRDMHQFADAIEDYEWVAMLKPGTGDASLGKSQCFVLQKNLPKAIECLNQAVAFEPKNPKYYIERGKVYWAMSKIDDALANFDKAQSIDPKNIDALTEQLRVHSYKQEYAKALQDANRLIMAGCRTYDTYLKRADLDMANNKPALAALGYALAAELQPSEIAPLIGRAKALATLKHDKAAIESLDAAIKLKPGDPELFALRGHLNMIANNGIAAANDFEKAIGLNASNVDAYLWRGEGLYDQKQYVSAQQDLEKVLRLDPRNIDAKFYLGLANSAIKKSPRVYVANSGGAQTSSTDVNDPKIKALLVSDNYNALSSAGMSEYGRGSYSIAIKLLSKAVKVNPAATACRRALAASLMASGYPSEAASQYKGVIAQEPGNSSDLNELSKALFDAKRFEDAITYINKYLAQNPKDADARCRLIEAYQSSGFNKKAQEICSEAIHSATDMSELSRYEEAMRNLSHSDKPVKTQQAPSNKPLADIGG